MEAWNKLDLLAKSTPYVVGENTAKIERVRKIERWSDRYTQHSIKGHAMKLAKAMDTDLAFFPEELHSVLVSTHGMNLREKKGLSFEEVLAKKLDTLDTNDDKKEDSEDNDDEVVYEEEEFEDEDDYTNAYFDDGDGYGDEGGGGADDEPVY